MEFATRYAMFISMPGLERWKTPNTLLHHASLRLSDGFPRGNLTRRCAQRLRRHPSSARHPRFLARASARAFFKADNWTKCGAHFLLKNDERSSFWASRGRARLLLAAHAAWRRSEGRVEAYIRVRLCIILHTNFGEH
jgi:hypothetical protein